MLDVNSSNLYPLGLGLDSLLTLFAFEVYVPVEVAYSVRVYVLGCWYLQVQLSNL